MKLLQEMATLSQLAVMQKEIFYARLKPVVKKYRMKKSEVILLFLLYLNPSLKTAKEICRISELKRGNVSILVEALTLRGFIRQETVLSDRRSRNLYLTDKANALIEEFEDEMEKMHNDMLAGISKEELELCTGVFKKISENVEKHSSKNKKNKSEEEGNSYNEESD